MSTKTPEAIAELPLDVIEKRIRAARDRVESRVQRVRAENRDRSAPP